MKLALFAKVRSNLEAITACMNHAQALGADQFAILGDMVDHGDDPVAVLNLVERYAAKGAVVVLGDHNSASLGHPADAMNAGPQAAIDWTRIQLRPKQREFLAGQAPTVRADNVLFAHASAFAPEQWIYVAGPGDALLGYATMSDADLMLIGTPWTGSGAHRFGSGICAQDVVGAPCNVTAERPATDRTGLHKGGLQ